MNEIKLNTIPEAISAIKKGELVIVVDDEDRENEGDFIVASELVTPEIINFMAIHGRGLICVALAENRCIVTKFEKDNPVQDAPEVFTDNPLCPANDESFWSTTLGSQISDPLAKKLVNEIETLYQYWNLEYCKGQFLENVGLSYLTLNRLSSTLSGGEFQRIKLATSLGSALVGSMYILDEPTVGLDDLAVEALRRVISSHRARGGMVMVATHLDLGLDEAKVLTLAAAPSSEAA